VKSTIVTTIIRSVPWLYSKLGKENAGTERLSLLLVKRTPTTAGSLSIVGAKGYYFVNVTNTLSGKQSVSKILVQ
jgi:hypothetical protein